MTTRSHLVKLSRPITTPSLPRKRLFSFLERTRDKPLVWVSGPAGSGKTTLIATYVDAGKLPCLWYQIDEGDGDPAAFFYHMGLAAKRACPRTRKQMPLFTPEYYQGIMTFAVRYFESLFSRLKTPSVVVLDNYQEAPADSLVHRMLAEGLNRIPEGIRVILISRAEPVPELSRFLARQSMEVIGWNDLRFTLSEARRVVKIWGRGALPGHIVEQMHQLTQGWVAGLVLLSQRTSGKKDGPQFLAEHPPDEIFDFFATEVLDKVDRNAGDFLMKTALLPSFSSEMAEAITGIQNARQLLSSLARGNYFLEKRRQPGISYQYHPLFRTFLQSRMKDRFTSDETLALQKRAASLLEGVGQTEDALSLYRQAGDWEGLSRIILTKAQELIVQGRNQTLLHWLDSLPEDFRNSSPWMLYWTGAALLPFDPAQAREWCENAYALFKAGRDCTGLYLSWAAIVYSIFWFERDRAGPLDRWIAELEELMNQYPQMPSPQVDAGVSISMFSAMAWYRPTHPRMPYWEKKIRALLQECRDPDHRIMMGTWLAFLYLYRGEMAKVEVVLDQLRPLPRHATVSPLATIMLLLFESYFQHLRGDCEGCRKVIEQGLETAETTGVHVLDFFLHASATHVSLAFGDMVAARANLEKMSMLLNRKSRNDTAHYHYLAGFEAFCRRDFQLARQQVETSLANAAESGTEMHIVLARIALAQILFELGERDQGEHQLAQAKKFNQRMKSHLLEYMITSVQASYALKIGLMEEGRQQLAKAFSLAREKCGMSPHFQVPSVLGELCAHALEAGIEVEYAQDLIKTCSLNSHYTPVGCERWPWPVKICALGEFSVLKEGKVLKFPVKTQKKPLEMLKVVVAYGGRGVTEEQASDILWPDAEGDRAHQSFATTLHRLRKLLGEEEVIRFREGRLTLDLQRIWVDAWAFERFAGEGDAALHKGETPRGLELCEKAISLYRGRFLGGYSGEPWADSYEKRLQSKYLRCVEAIGKHLEESGEWDAAAKHYTQGLEADELAERLYQRLMRCLGAMGCKADMSAVYERCKKVLEDRLGMDPSPETEALYQSLISEKHPRKRGHLRLL